MLNSLEELDWILFSNEKCYVWKVIPLGRGHIEANWWQGGQHKVKHLPEAWQDDRVVASVQTRFRGKKNSVLW